ncbi:MAG: hypothetical protein R2731_05695 [Nocardioides sp.]
MTDTATARAASRWRTPALTTLAGLLLGSLVAVVGPSVAGVTGATAPSAKAAAVPYYTKDQSDARYLRKPKVLRGGWAFGSAAPGGFGLAGIAWGFSMKKAPTAHFILDGGKLPDGCSGTAAAPNAKPGHLCVFETAASGYADRFICTTGNSCGGKASRFGAYVGATATANGGYAYGSWALGVKGITTGKLAEVTTTPQRLTPGPAR